MTSGVWIQYIITEFKMASIGGGLCTCSTYGYSSKPSEVLTDYVYKICCSHRPCAHDEILLKYHFILNWNYVYLEIL